jgi:cysteinyl-tRNA synthetase
MVLRLHNSLTRGIEDFSPLNGNKVALYTCGPTVYNFPHIGNYRAYIFSDLLKRTLSYNDFEVKHIMNLTDIDDKTIRDSQKEGKSLKEFTEFYTEEFYKDRDMLAIIPAKKYTKATDYIKEMLLLTETLIEKGFAYKGEDDSIYFSIEKDEDYGKLAHLDRSKLLENAKGRMKSDEYDKDNAQDFALWKMWDEADGEVFWVPSEILGKDTDIPKGRPGWHIECSAMAMATLGETIDIHTGGIDNMFPHHENEIAQSECATGEPFSKFFMHNEHLLVENKKMSKSAGNFYTLRDIVEKGYDPISYRYLNLGTHYRTPLNFSFESLEGAKTALKKMRSVIETLPEGGMIDEKYEELFRGAINDDLNIPKALGIAWTMIADENVEGADKRATLLKFDEVFGLSLDKVEDIQMPEEVTVLVEKRALARAKKDFALSDTLRAEINALGYEVKDTADGQKVSKI